MPLHKTEHIPCPNCTATAYTVQHKVQQWQIVQCKHCKFTYTNPRLTNSAIIALYQSNYFANQQFGYSNYNENPHLKKLNFKKWITDALPHCNRTHNLTALDVGCAAGYALEEYKNLQIQADGLDMDEQYIYNLTQQGYTIYTKPLLQNVYNKQYHIISLFDVVEHLTDVHLHFAKLQQLLVTGGIVIIVTPNYNSTQRRLLGSKWFQFKPIEHINYFTKKSLKSLASRHGLQMLVCNTSGQFADVNFINNRLQKYNFGFAKILTTPIIAVLKMLKKPLYLDSASIYCVFRKKG